jgi:hypothetical protein
MNYLQQCIYVAIPIIIVFLETKLATRRYLGQCYRLLAIY